jgi:1,2-diacylglycerol 3-beta-galactosyltransferase
MKKRILFLMSDTGGGHRAAAQALKEAIQYLYPHQYKIIIEDIWKEHLPWPFKVMPDTYGWMTGPGLPLWKAIWQVSASPRRQHYIFAAVGPVVKDRVVRYLTAVQPDLVVSVHPLMNHLGLEWLKQTKLDIPFITVITDMVTFHSSWICPQVTRCLVPTVLARDRALQFGMPAEKLAVYGQPVSLKFAKLKGGKLTFRRQLGLDEGRYTVLLVGGGEGFGHIFHIARQVSKTVSQAQLLIVAGRNRRLKDKLGSVAWEIPTRVYGFVDNMPELMKASDVLVTRAGPGTISEAFIAGLPLLLFGYIPGQETGNVAYVQKNEAGVYTESPVEIAKQIRTWMNPDNPTLAKMTQNAACLARPWASLQIAADLCQYV